MQLSPRDSAVLSGNSPGPHKIQGIGAGFVPEVLDLNIVDEIITVSNEDAFATSRKLMKEEGIMVGISAGAIIWAALELAKREGISGKNFGYSTDTAERYISTPPFTERSRKKVYFYKPSFINETRHFLLDCNYFITTCVLNFVKCK